MSSSMNDDIYTYQFYRYSLVTKIINDKQMIKIYLYNNKTKQIHYDIFTKNALQQFGFMDKQVSNLKHISQFIVNEISKPHNSIVVNNTNNNVIIRISKTYDSLLSINIEIVLKLIERNKVYIMEEYIEDLQNDNGYMKKQLFSLRTLIEENENKHNSRMSTLQNRIGKLQQKYEQDMSDMQSKFNETVNHLFNDRWNRVILHQCGNHATNPLTCSCPEGYYMISGACNRQFHHGWGHASQAMSPSQWHCHGQQPKIYLLCLPSK
eukprot:458864_1